MKSIFDLIEKKNKTIIKLTAEGENVYSIIRTKRADENTVYITGTRFNESKPEFAFILDDKFNYHVDPNDNVRVMFGNELEYIVI